VETLPQWELSNGGKLLVALLGIVMYLVMLVKV
jgi:hypothetical protein